MATGQDTRTLAVSLVAKSELFTRGMKSAQASLKSFNKGVATVSADLGRMATRGAVAFAALATAGVYGLTRIINTTRESMDSMLMLSQQLGTTTEDVQVLTRAAELDGVSVESMTANLKKMTNGLGEASLGAGAAKGALDALGLDAKKLIQLPLSEQFGAIADKISGLSTQAQKAAMATQIFGRSGVDMLVMLDRGSAVIGNMKDEMGRTGELFSTEDAMKVEEMGDAIVKLTGVYNAFAQNLTIQLAPILTEVITQFQVWVESAGGAGPVISGAMDVAVRGVGRVMNIMQSMQALWYELKGIVLLVAAAWVNAFTFSMKNLSVLLLGIGRTFMEVVNQIAGGIDLIISKATSIASVVASVNPVMGAAFAALGMSGAEPNMQAQLKPYLDDAIKASDAANAEWLAHVKTLGGADPYVQSFMNDSREALAKGKEIRDNPTDWVSSLSDQYAQIQDSAAMRAADAQSEKAAMMDSEMLPALEKEQRLQEGITGEMEAQAKLSKDTGTGTSMRAGEFAQNVGRIFGGTGTVATPGEVSGSPTSYAARGAMAAGDARTGADASIPLLQGILDAARQTATNTMRPAVAVAG